MSGGAGFDPDDDDRPDDWIDGPPWEAVVYVLLGAVVLGCVIGFAIRGF